MRSAPAKRAGSSETKALLSIAVRWSHNHFFFDQSSDRYYGKLSAKLRYGSNRTELNRPVVFQFISDQSHGTVLFCCRARPTIDADYSADFCTRLSLTSIELQWRLTQAKDIDESARWWVNIDQHQSLANRVADDGKDGQATLISIGQQSKSGWLGSNRHVFATLLGKVMDW